MQFYLRIVQRTAELAPSVSNSMNIPPLALAVRAVGSLALDNDPPWKLKYVDRLSSPLSNWFHLAIPERTIANQC